MNRLQFATVKSIEQGLIKAAGALSKDLGEIAAPVRRSIDDAVVHAVNDLAALVHHATPGRGIPIHALIGGTGTGKSTLVNRLFGATVSATSYRRTFTTGPVAIVRGSADLPGDWLGLPAVVADEVPSRGVPGALAVVKQPGGSDLIVIDTPDIDGDHPAHIAVADRVFRWADRLVFVVTPEKYQMTELLPYYRLARRYRVPTLFVMNKTEQSVVVDDFRQQLAGREWGDASIYVIERDDSMFVPPEEHSLDRLRNFLAQPAGDDPAVRRAGLRERGRDIVNRVSDQVLTPLRDQRRYCLNILNALNAIETPPPRVDVNPITEQLQRRLQQRSILYLIGPARVLDRVRQVPQLLMRLPRSLVDIARGQKVAIPDPTESQASMAEPPDFSALLLDQMRIVQSRIDDIIRTTPLAAWLDDPQRGYAQAHIDPAEAGKIAAEELADLQNWLQQRWESNPRDTRLIMNIMKRLPGGQKLTKWTETAPYLLAVIVATHHAFFGHIDLIVLGGYGLATWITERLSNEVSARARLTNKRIADRFTDLGRRQIEQVRRWLKSQVADDATTARLERDLDELAQQCDAGQEH